jgi:signal transduction histidine kinase
VSSQTLPLEDGPAQSPVADPRRAPAATGAWPTALIQRSAERVKQKLSAHPRSSDLALVAAIVGIGVAGLWSQQRLDAQQLAFSLALSLPLLLRRRQPMLVFGCVTVVALVQWQVADPQLADAALLVALYGVALRGSLIELALAASVMEVGAVMAAIRWAPSDPAKIWIGLSGLVVAAAVLGISIRQHRALLASLHERAARLELERDQQGRLAAAAERNRIARELHDIVTHNLSVMVALADGAAYAMASCPERAVGATSQISATGRDALLEMRRLLGLLGEKPPTHPLRPQPRMADLGQLVERVRAAGVPVSLLIEGDPKTLPEGIQLTVFRVAQEALTNTLKHASRPTEAVLVLRCAREGVEFEAIDTGAPVLDGRGVPAGCRGLSGMSERVRAYGGELQAGPRPVGGWRVHMILRLASGAAVSERDPDRRPEAVMSSAGSGERHRRPMSFDVVR